MDPNIEPRRRQGSTIGTLIARITDSSNLVREVNFYRRLPTQAAPGSGPYPPDIVRRPSPGAGVYEYDFVLDTELDTIGTIELVLEDGRIMRSAEQTFPRRNPDAGMSLPLTGGTLTGILTTPGLVSTGPVAARMSYSDVTSAAALELGNASGTRRFVLGLRNTEAGNASGGNLALWRHSDTGTTVDAVLAVSRATGVVSFTSAPTVNGSVLALGSQLSAYLPLAGGTLSGVLSLPELRVSGALSFGANARQMLNLWETSYAIGVQEHTQYFRTGGGFAWYLGGVHAPARWDAGGGSTLMSLQSGGLSVAGAVSVAGGNSSWGNVRLYNGNEWGGGGLAYPTIGSTAGGGLVMLRRPHIPHFGEGSYVRMATDTAVSAYWDMGAIGDEFKVRRSGSTAAFLVERQGAACIDRTDTWTGDISSSRNHLHLRAASDVWRSLTLTYSATGGPGDWGFGVIAAGRIGVGWTPLALQPSGGPVCVGGLATADYALNVQGKAFASAGLVTGTTEWLSSRAHGASIHGTDHLVLTRSHAGIAVQNQAGSDMGYVSYDGTGFGLKHAGGGWSVLTSAGGVKLHGQVVDDAGNTFVTSVSGTGSPTMAAREGAIYIQY